MHLAGQKRRVLTSTIRLAGRDYRVIRPARPIAHAPLHEGRFGSTLSVDKAATIDLAIAWWLAARSPHSLVHLPLRSGRASCGEEYGGRRLDLVLLHHSLQFPPSRWKQLRAQSPPSAIHTVTLPPEPFRTISHHDYDRRSHQEFRDHLRWTVAADTLFLIGSRHAYELSGDQIRELAEDSPARLAAHPDRHYCAEIDLGRSKPAAPDRRNPYSLLHIERCNRHR